MFAQILYYLKRMSWTLHKNFFFQICPAFVKWYTLYQIWLLHIVCLQLSAEIQVSHIFSLHSWLFLFTDEYFWRYFPGCLSARKWWSLQFHQTLTEICSSKPPEKRLCCRMYFIILPRMNRELFPSNDIRVESSKSDECQSMVSSFNISSK